MLDVMPYLGSNAAVAVMVENMGKVNDEIVEQWLTAIAFIPRPDEETLSSVLQLLNTSKSNRQVPLS